MIIYSHEGGYANVDLKAVDKAIRSLPLNTPGRQDLLEVMYQYEVLLSIIEGKNCVFGHKDGSQTRRIKIW